MDFAHALVDPPSPRCLGLRLRPFSLGHLLILRQMDSAFVSGRFPQYEDLIATTFVCAHTWEENQPLVSSTWNMWIVVNRWIGLKLWGLFNRRCDMIAETIVLKSYINSAQELPEVKPQKSGGTRALISEWDTRLYAHLRGIGHSRIEALDLPLVEANKLFVAHLEIAGVIEFKSARDLVIEDALTRGCEQMEADEQKELSA